MRGSAETLDRDRSMVIASINGESYASIARRYGLTRQGCRFVVREWLLRAGVNAPARKRTKVRGTMGVHE